MTAAISYSLQDLLLSVSLATYLSTCVIVAVVRWGHKCAPQIQDTDYYYPSWRTLVACALSNLSLIPVIFLPSDPDAVLQLRMMLLLASPLFCSVLIFNYFGSVLKQNWWRKPTLAMYITYILMGVVALVTTLIPGEQMQGMFRSIYFIVAGLLAVFYLLSLIIAMIMMIQPLSQFSEESFSNPEDFPHEYAKSLIIIPLLHMILSWSATFNGKPSVLSFSLIMLSVLSVIILLGSLSPHRAVEVERVEAEVKADQTEQSKEPVLLPQERKEEILQAIRLQMEQEKACLNSHLTLSKLSQLCGYNRTYVSSVLNESLGGFFSYVNHCRLAHAKAYRDAHPEASIDEVALESGFNNRQSYYNAIKKDVSSSF